MQILVKVRLWGTPLFTHHLGCLFLLHSLVYSWTPIPLPLAPMETSASLSLEPTSSWATPCSYLCIWHPPSNEDHLPSWGNVPPSCSLSFSCIKVSPLLWHSGHPFLWAHLSDRWLGQCLLTSTWLMPINRFFCVCFFSERGISLRTCAWKSSSRSRALGDVLWEEMLVQFWAGWGAEKSYF